MENESREGTVNLATLCLNLYEDIERKQGVGQRWIKPLPKDNSFVEEVVLKEYIYHALYTAICELIGNYCNDGKQAVVSTYQTGILLLGLDVSYGELMEVCKEESNKLQIQKSRLGLALAFLRLEQVKIEQLYEGSGEGLGFALLNRGI